MNKDKSLMKFYNEEEGQGLVEYGLILSFIAILVIVSLGVIGTQIGRQFGEASQELEFSSPEEEWVIITTEDGVYIEKTNALGRLIGKFEGDGTAIRIPLYLDGKLIKEIGQDVFRDKGLTDIQFNDAISRIHARAFQDNALSYIELPQGLTRIDWGAFRNNSLTEVRLPSTVTLIEGSAFAGNNITRVSIGSGVEIKDNAFGKNHAGFVAAYESGGAGTFVFKEGSWVKE